MKKINNKWCIEERDRYIKKYGDTIRRYLFDYNEDKTKLTPKEKDILLKLLDEFPENTWGAIIVKLSSKEYIEANLDEKFERVKELFSENWRIKCETLGKSGISEDELTEMQELFKELPGSYHRDVYTLVEVVENKLPEEVHRKWRRHSLAQELVSLRNGTLTKGGARIALYSLYKWDKRPCPAVVHILEEYGK